MAKDKETADDKRKDKGKNDDKKKGKKSKGGNPFANAAKAGK